MYLLSLAPRLTDKAPVKPEAFDVNNHSLIYSLNDPIHEKHYYTGSLIMSSARVVQLSGAAPA